MRVRLILRQRITVAGLHVIVLVLLALQLYVRTLPATAGALPEPTEPESVWWGLWPIRYPPSWAVSFGVVGLILCLCSWWVLELRRRRSSEKCASAQPLRLESLPRSQHSALGLWLPLLAVLVSVAFFLFPIVHTRWGDAYLLAKSIAWPDPALRLTHSWQAPLDVVIHSRLWLWGYARFRWQDAAPVYRLLSPVAGMLYLGATLALSRDDHLAPAWLSFGLLTTLGLIQLFFGYVENYSFAAAGILVYLWLGWQVDQGQRTLWPAASVLALTNALHPSTIILAPSLLYLGWRQARWARQRNKSTWPIVYSIVIPMLLVAGGVLLFMEVGGHGLAALFSSDRPGGADARPFVPLWATQTRWERYTLFSWPHLRDLLNGQGLVAPVVWPSVVICQWSLVFGHWSVLSGEAGVMTKDKGPAPATQPFLAIAALSYLLFICVWNPDYGGQRDWDLFSLAALPATLWLVGLLPRALPDRRYLVAGAAPLILVQGLHTIAWVYQNTLPWAWP